MTVRVAGLMNDSIVDGPGFRFTVFTQGCPHGCPGCHNPQTHDFSGGTLMETEDIIARFSNNPLLDGITLSGGEPFAQPDACAAIADAAHKLGLNVWCYSGYTYEQLLAMPAALPLLEKVDILVDGPFIIAKKTLDARFRGSSNQRLIDVQASLRAGHAVEHTI